MHISWNVHLLAVLGLVSMMLHYVAVDAVVSVSLTGMHKTGRLGEATLVLHVICTSSLVLQLAVCSLIQGNCALTFAQALDTGTIKFWLSR